MNVLRITCCTIFCALLIWGNVANASKSCNCIFLGNQNTTEMPCHENHNSEGEADNCENCQCDHGLSSQLPVKITTNAITTLKSITYQHTAQNRYQLSLEISSDPPKHIS